MDVTRMEFGAIRNSMQRQGNGLTLSGKSRIKVVEEGEGRT